MERRELVQRLLAERKAKGHTLTGLPGSSDSRADRYQRIQKLLGERRAKLELEESENGSQQGLLSPGSTSGMPSEGRHNPAQSEGWCGSWTPLDSTPGGPHLEYSLDDPPHIVASQHPGASKHHGGGADNSWTGERAPSGTRRGGRVGGALGGSAGAALTPQSTASLELPAAQATSACRQLEWDGRASPYRSDSASSTQPRPSWASRAGPGRRRDAGGGAAAPVPTAAQGLFQGKHNGDAPRPASEEGELQDQGNQILQQSLAQQADQLRHGPSVDECAQHEPEMSGVPAVDQASQVSMEGSACRSDKSLPGRSRLLKQKLFAALRGTPEGPIELDPAMLYSPASSLQPPSSGSGTPEQARSADGSAARRTGRQLHSATAPRAFRLSSSRPSSARAALAERILAERRSGAPSRPCLNAPSAGRGSDPSAAGTLEGEARLARLAQPRTQLWERWAQKKLEEHHGDLAECSFAPRTGRGPTSGSRAAAAKLPAPVRLYANHSTKYKQWARLKAEQEKEALQQCTFTPSVNESKDAHTPLHRRLQELQRQRRERLAKLQAAVQPAEGVETYSPAVNEKSMRMALTKQIRDLHDEVPAYQRLGALRRQAPNKDQGIDKDLTFAPSINASSARLLEDSAQLPGRFLQRQRFFYDLKQQRMRILRAEDGSECTFSPKTEEHSRVILAASANSDRLQQESSDQIARLAVADKERVEGARAAAAHAYYSQFTFQPAINPKSKQLVREDRLAELASDNTRRERLEAAAAQRERERDRECTFHPVLNSGTLCLSDQENQSPAAEDQEDKGRAKRLADARSRKRAILEQQRRARESEELAECSFAPIKPRRPPLARKGAVKVHGMEHYMRNKQHARQLEQEQRARERKAFILEPRQHLDPCTVPEPFALQTKLRELETVQRRAQLQAQILADSMRECTFRPQTNEDPNRELLRAIMQEDDEDPLESIASASTV